MAETETTNETMQSLAGAAVDDAWAFGLGSALFFGWLIAALFPLV